MSSVIKISEQNRDKVIEKQDVIDHFEKAEGKECLHWLLTGIKNKPH